MLLLFIEETLLNAGALRLTSKALIKDNARLQLSALCDITVSGQLNGSISDRVALG